MENFSREINEDLAEVRERVEVIRRKISDNRASPDNFNGFLREQVDTYIGDFDSQIVKVNERLQADREFWEREAAQSAEQKNKKIMQMKGYLFEVKKKLASTIFDAQFTEAIDIAAKCPLKDLPCFGRPKYSEDEEFRWPTLAIL